MRLWVNSNWRRFAELSCRRQDFGQHYPGNVFKPHSIPKCKSPIFRSYNRILLHQVSLDILQTLVRASTVPLSDALVSSAFPAAVQVTLKSDDSATMQSGGECLRAYVSKSLDQVAAWQDGQGKYSSWKLAFSLISSLVLMKTPQVSVNSEGFSCRKLLNVWTFKVSKVVEINHLILLTTDFSFFNSSCNLK